MFCIRLILVESLAKIELISALDSDSTASLIRYVRTFIMYVRPIFPVFKSFSTKLFVIQGIFSGKAIT